MGRVEGKVAIITGGAGGIGRAIALRLGQEGALVVITDLDAQHGVAAVADLADQGVRVLFVAHDVRDEASWQAVIDTAVMAHGKVDVVVNNAGVAGPPPDAFEDIEFAEWRRILSVNLDGTFLGTKAAVRAMRAAGGSIINMGSVAAYVGTPGGAAYGSSKGGVRTLTKQAAVMCAKRGYRVRINTIHPCYVWTPLVEARATQVFGAEAAREGIRAIHPFRCLAEPVDVANVALFLASDESRLVNGSDLVVDGALLAQ